MPTHQLSIIPSAFTDRFRFRGWAKCTEVGPKPEAVEGEVSINIQSNNCCAQALPYRPSDLNQA